MGIDMQDEYFKLELDDFKYVNFILQSIYDPNRVLFV
jgi:hypothetical protein